MRKGERAFTLIEVLVSTTILALMLLLVTSVINSTANVTGGAMNNLAVQNEAHSVFSRLALDLDGLPDHQDLPSRFLKANGNDSIALVSRVPGLSGDRGVSRVEYRFGDFFGESQLLRGAESYSFTGAGKLEFDPGAFSPTGPILGPDSYQPLGTGVARFEISFLAADGSISEIPVPLSELRGIFVAIAMVPKAIKSQFPDWEDTFLTKFADAPGGESPASQWDVSSLPSPLSQNTRVFERLFPFPNPIQ